MDRLIDVIKQLKAVIEEQSKLINQMDNKFSSDMKRLEEKLIMLENRIENYRFMVEKRYVPALVERLEDDEKRMKSLEDRLESIRIQWSDFRSMVDEKMKEI